MLLGATLLMTEIFVPRTHGETSAGVLKVLGDVPRLCFGSEENHQDMPQSVPKLGLLVMPKSSSDANPGMNVSNLQQKLICCHAEFISERSPRTVSCFTILILLTKITSPASV